MNAALVFMVLVGVANAISIKDVINEEFDEFKMRYNKIYSDQREEMFRKKIFLENRHKISKHNQRFLLGARKYGLGMNEYGDLLHSEFVAQMNGFQRDYNNRKLNGTTYLSPANVEAPKTVDWRKHGYVTPIKNQGNCGSCWSFSATGALEGQHFKKTGKLVSLSEQNLVDCSTKYGNQGCSGGLMDQAFQYVKDNHGIDTEMSYPYEAEDDTCRYNPKNSGATDTGFVDIPQADEKALTEAIATIGPISVAIDASHESFQFYSSGIYDEPDCSTEALDHGVLAVGYGSMEGRDYYIVKNSWGTTWGEKGYLLMSRNNGNQCGIASAASYPLV